MFWNSKLEHAALTKSSLSQFYKAEGGRNIDFLKAPEKGALFVVVLKWGTGVKDCGF